MKKLFTTKVLDTTYTVYIDTPERNPKLRTMDAYCDGFSKKIILDASLRPVYRNHVLNHELTHAFLHECGLADQSDWAQKEEVIDWIALQTNKLNKVLTEANKSLKEVTSNVRQKK